MYQYNDYLPDFLVGFKELDALGRAADAQVMSLVQRLDRLMSNQFILTADAATIRRWESMLQIIPAASDSLDTRRFRVRARLTEQLPYTMRRLHEILTALVGADGYTLLLYAAEYRLRCRIALEQKAQYAEAQRMIRNMMPANIVLDLDLRYRTHGMLKPYTHRILSGYTHNQLRNEAIEEG